MTGEQFDTIPEHARAVTERHAIEPSHLTPLSRQWRTPIAVWDAHKGFDASKLPDNFDHHTLTVQTSRALIRRMSTRGTVLEDDCGTSDMVCLQVAHGDHRFVAPSNISFAHLYFTHDFMTRLKNEIFKGDRSAEDLLRTDRLFQRNAELRHLTDTYIARAVSAEDVPSALEMDARATLIGLSIFRSFSNDGRQSPILHRGGLAPWQLRRACEYLESHLADDVTLTDIADEARLSPFHFARAFKASTGMPPHAYLMRLRLERAKALLVETDRPVTEIALDCGYESSQALARLFQRAVGCTPSAWRREKRP